MDAYEQRLLGERQGRSDNPERERTALRGPRRVGPVTARPSPPRLRGASGEVEAASVVTAAFSNYAKAKWTHAFVRPPILDCFVHESVDADTVRRELGVRRETL